MAAAVDRYEPPRDGEVSREQLRQFFRVADDTVSQRARFGIADEPGRGANRALYAREQAQLDAALEKLTGI